VGGKAPIEPPIEKSGGVAEGHDVGFLLYYGERPKGARSDIEKSGERLQGARRDIGGRAPSDSPPVKPRLLLTFRVG